ncbi:hypothetical protein SAMN05443667_11412 [Flavobacterium gillisiae]|uniref:Uncharacterized protein n=1 Tax=Flavobacterium gillisiae TaxID=150146 RepID=A0A1H4FLH3_9FLAO|nr:hypothetical protein SAMN05443667_11412 [Flavobacterium gillisiae]
MITVEKLGVILSPTTLAIENTDVIYPSIYKDSLENKHKI